MGNERRRQSSRRRMVAGLLAGTAVREDLDAEALRREERVAARIAWTRRLIDDYFAAMQRCDAAWMKLVEPYADWDPDDDIPDLDPPPEQAEVDRLYALLSDMRDRDRWPRHLHWSV